MCVMSGVTVLMSSRPHQPAGVAANFGMWFPAEARCTILGGAMWNFGVTVSVFCLPTIIQKCVEQVHKGEPRDVRRTSIGPTDVRRTCDGRPTDVWTGFKTAA